MFDKRFVSLLAAALIAGLLITWNDSRPTWDDTGVSAAMIFFAAVLLGAAMPSRAWVWALAVGLWVPLVGVVRGGSYAAFLALAVAFAGAYAGAFVRRLLGVRAG